MEVKDEGGKPDKMVAIFSGILDVLFLFFFCGLIFLSFWAILSFVSYFCICYHFVTMSTPSKGNLTPEQFVIRAIERLRKPPYKGIHSVFSGFNQAFREYFPLLDPVDITAQLVSEKKIVIRPAKKGVMLYKAEDLPSGPNTNEVIDTITKDE